MAKMRRRGWALLMTLVMVLGLLPASVLAANEIDTPNGTYDGGGLFEYHLTDAALEEILLSNDYPKTEGVDKVTLYFGSADRDFVYNPAAHTYLATFSGWLDPDRDPQDITELVVELENGESIAISASELKAVLYDKAVPFYELALQNPDITEKCTVTFYWQKGGLLHYEEYESVLVEKGTSLGDQMPADPSWLTYQFGGWELDSSDGTGADFDRNTIVDRDMKVYARKLTVGGGSAYHVMDRAFAEDGQGRSGVLTEAFAKAVDAEVQDVDIRAISAVGDGIETNPDYFTNGWKNDHDYFYIYNVDALAADITPTLQNTRVSLEQLTGINLYGTVNGQEQVVFIPKEDLSIKVLSHVGSTDVIVEIYLKEEPVVVPPESNGLSINKTTQTKEVTPGSEVVYTITVTNSNSEDKTLTVVDALNENLVFVSSDGTYDAAAHSVTWADVTVPAGDQVSLTLTVQVSPECPVNTRIDNTAVIQNGGEEDDSSTEIVDVVAPVYDYQVRYELITLVNGASSGESVYVYSQTAYTASSAPSVQDVWSTERTEIQDSDGLWYQRAATWTAGEAVSNGETLESGKLMYTVKYYRDADATLYDYKVCYELITLVNGVPSGESVTMDSKISYSASSAPSAENVWAGEKSEVLGEDGNTYSKAAAWTDGEAVSNGETLESGKLVYTVKYYRSEAPATHSYQVQYQLITRVDGAITGEDKFVSVKNVSGVSVAPEKSAVWTASDATYLDGTVSYSKGAVEEVTTSGSFENDTLVYTVVYYHDTYTSGTLQITKTFTGDFTGNEEELDTFSITVTGPNDYEKTLDLKPIVSRARGVYTWTLKGLDAGTYTVTENNASVPGYTWTVTASGYNADTEPVVGTSTASYEVDVNLTGTASALSITNDYDMAKLTIAFDGGAHGRVVDNGTPVVDGIIPYTRANYGEDGEIDIDWAKNPKVDEAGVSRVTFAFDRTDVYDTVTMNTSTPTVQADDGWECDGNFYSADYHNGDQAFTTLRDAAEYMLANGLTAITFAPSYNNPGDGGDGGDGGNTGGGGGGGSTDIPDEGTPTTDLPDEGTPTTDLPDEGTPTTDLPEEEVPMAEAPKTGDNLTAWILAAGVSGLGLVWLALNNRKRGQENA